MDEAQRSEIARVVPSVLERFAFLFADPIDPSDFAVGEDGYLAGSLTFNGPVKGGMLVAVPEPMARELAANLLGADNDDPKAGDHAHDSLGEFLNVACGHILTALRGSGEVFDLSAPRLFPLTAAEAAAVARKPGGFAFEVDGAPFLFQASFCGCCAPEAGPLG